VAGDNKKVRAVAGVPFPDRKHTISKITLLRFTVRRI
jgi:hypothetical protein